MSFMAKIAAGAATLALAGSGLGMVGTQSASAKTPSCGGCTNWYTQKFGPAFVLDDLYGYFGRQVCGNYHRMDEFLRQYCRRRRSNHHRLDRDPLRVAGCHTRDRIGRDHWGNLLALCEARRALEAPLFRSRNFGSSLTVGEQTYH